MATAGPATAWGTIVYAGEALHPQTRRRVHVLGFQTRISNDFHRANAVILPVPSAAALGPANLIDVPFSALEDMAATLHRMNPQRGFETPDTRVFPRGSFTVVLSRVDDVVRAIGGLPPELQPPVDRKVFSQLAERYPGVQVALCCWQGTLHAGPLALWYEPLDSKVLFLPVPVSGDRTLVVGSCIRPFGVVASPRLPPGVASYLPTSVWGQVMKGAGAATDYEVDTAPLQQLDNVAGKYDLHPRLDPKLWAVRFEPWALSRFPLRSGLRGR